MKTATCNIHSITVHNSDGTTQHFTFNLKPRHPKRTSRETKDRIQQGNAPRVARYRGQPLTNSLPI